MQLCFQIFNGKSPLVYAEENHPEENDMINSSPELREILEKCFQKDYTKRPTAEDLYNDPFFSEYTTEE